MCRILAISGKTEYRTSALILKKFQCLAEFGKAPQKGSKGHRDGWGIAAYENNKSILFVRSFKNAYKDSGYMKAVEKLKNKKSDIIIGHLRRASVGTKNIENTHPFFYGAYAFCQNGTVIGSEGIPLKDKFKKIIKGKTDSERLFAYILQFLAEYKKPNPKAIRGAISKAINYIRKNLDFTAANIIFSDGKYVWALREVNEKNEDVKKNKLLNYYSLFFGSSHKYSIISSEILLKDMKWRSFENHELLQVDFKSQKAKLFSLSKNLN